MLNYIQESKFFQPLLAHSLLARQFCIRSAAENTEQLKTKPFHPLASSSKSWWKRLLSPGPFAPRRGAATGKNSSGGFRNLGVPKV